MKKLYTLAVLMMFAVAAFAADGRPMVTVRSNDHYKIVIDGRAFYGHNNVFDLPDVRQGRHTVKVFEMRRGLFGFREVLVDATTFYVNYNDIVIGVNNWGNINIQEIENRYRHDNGNHNGWYKKDRRDRDNNGRYDDDDDRYEKRGRG